MSEPSNDCDRWAEPISLLAADCLTETEAAAVRAHLAGCAACQERYAELKTLGEQLARSVAPADLPAELLTDAGLRAALVSAGTEEGMAAPAARIRPTPVRIWGRRFGRLAAAALAAALLVALLARLPGDHDQDAPPIAVGDRAQPASSGSGSPPSVAALATNFGADLAAGAPTLLDLRRAFAESDEALEFLLTQTHAPQAADPDGFRPGYGLREEMIP